MIIILTTDCVLSCMDREVVVTPLLSIQIDVHFWLG